MITRSNTRAAAIEHGATMSMMSNVYVNVMREIMIVAPMTYGMTDLRKGGMSQDYMGGRIRPPLMRTRR